MPAYRFCRTDDIPFLVDALNACYFVHFPDQKPLSVADFKREIRELNVWSSSCMAASEDGKPIAVVTGAKREHESWIHRIGVHPDHLRQGHARHLLESLSHKLSVLGPPKIVAEVSDEQPEVRDLFEAVAYGAVGSFADFALAGRLAASASRVTQIGLDDLLRDEAFDLHVSRSWERALETLQNRKNQLQGIAIAKDTRIEAYALFRDLPEHGRREIVALGASRRQHDGDTEACLLLEQVLGVACQAGPLDVTVPRVSCEEIPWAQLESMGFRKGRTYTGYAEFPASRMH